MSHRQLREQDEEQNIQEQAETLLTQAGPSGLSKPSLLWEGNSMQRATRNA
jgi:hypothetical protein